MRKKLFSMLLAVLLIISFGSVAVFGESGPDPPVYLDPTVINTFSLPIRLKINQASSSNPQTTLYFDCSYLDSLYYTDPTDQNPLTSADMTFPNVTVSNVVFNKGEATLAGTVKNAAFTIPAISQVGIYEYRFFACSDHDSINFDHWDVILRISVFNGQGGKQMAVSVSVGDVVGYDPVTGDPIWEYQKIDEFEIEYAAYEYSITKEVDGNLGDRDKEFEFTVKLEGTWYKMFVTGDPYHNEANGYPHVTIGYSGGHSISGSFDLEDLVTTETTLTSYDIPGYGLYEYTTYAHSFEKEITFSLRHGETVTFTNIPEGVTVTTTEAPYSADGYETTINGEARSTESYTVYDPEPVFSYETGMPVPVIDPVTGNQVYQYGNGSVTVTNTKNVPIDTGVSLDDLPYIISIVVAAAGGILFFIIRKRRKSDEDDM